MPSRRTRLLRLWFALASRVIPAVAARHLAALFLTPKRRRPRAPVIPVLPSREWALHIAGHHIAAWSWGEGPTVLLVHGWSGLAADLAPVADAVVRAGYRAVAFDMPAHGRSSGRRTSLGEWRRLLPALARAVTDSDGVAERSATGNATGRVHAVVAHSFGAAAVTLALDAGLRADRVVLLAPVQGPAYFLGRTHQYLGLSAASLADVERRLAVMVGEELAAFDAATAAAALTLPALILHDPLDPEVPWAHAAAIASAWRGSVLLPIAGHGHTRVLSAPEVLAHVADFVAVRSVVATDGP